MRSESSKSSRQFFVCLVCFALLVISCQTESDKVRELRERMQKNKQKLQNVNDNIRVINEELMTMWVYSLKYRFPRVNSITADEVLLNLAKEGLPYLKSIRFQYKTNHDFKITCTYQSEQEKVRPHFMLYLFDQYGANVHKGKIDYKPKYLLFGKDLPKGKLVTQEYNVQVSCSSIPFYFMITKAPDSNH